MKYDLISMLKEAGIELTDEQKELLIKLNDSHLSELNGLRLDHEKKSSSSIIYVKTDFHIGDNISFKPIKYSIYFSEDNSEIEITPSEYGAGFVPLRAALIRIDNKIETKFIGFVFGNDYIVVNGNKGKYYVGVYSDIVDGLDFLADYQSLDYLQPDYEQNIYITENDISSTEKNEVIDNKIVIDSEDIHKEVIISKLISPLNKMKKIGEIIREEFRKSIDYSSFSDTQNARHI